MADPLEKKKKKAHYDTRMVNYGRERIEVPTSAMKGAPRKNVVKGVLAEETKYDTDYKMELPENFQNIFTAREEHTSMAFEYIRTEGQPSRKLDLDPKKVKINHDSIANSY